MNLPERCDVAIIGAGAIGCSIAYHLCQRGVTDVLLIDREEFPGCGSTARANGGIRAQFTTPANIRMSLLSMDLLDAFDEEMKSQSGYVKAGYLFVTADPENLRRLKKNIRLQQRHGVPVQFLPVRSRASDRSRPEIEGRFPYLKTDDLLGGSYGARDGFIDPGGLTLAFYSGALHKGARALMSCTATGLVLEGGRVTGVDTDRGRIQAEAVVNAAGPYARQVAEWAGVDLPVHPIRSNIAVTGPTPDWPRRIPMTVDMDTGLLVRREGAGCALAWTNPDEPPGFDSRFDPTFLEHIAAKIERRFPRLVGAGIDFSRCWAGLYPETPDHHAILGDSGVAGFFLATGLGGHGIMHAPAVGCVLSELIATGRSQTMDLRPFRLTRFAEGDLNLEGAVL